ncbi:MAG: tRNA (adenosine(37)-N6)-threonylcarbamoyltransferase complex ATPase subunit type 1 TsaE [Christensenellaceae bacterium]|jgi:tRNA threonylcarbamoyladenosine biosynthesis protein TsaE
MTETYILNETQLGEYAKKIADCLGNGSFIGLYGDLGAGKTTFVKGLAEGLGVTETITSPTYTLLLVYESGRIPLYHYDVYRCDSTDELADLDFYEKAEGDGVCVVEWADRIEEALPAKRWDIKLEYAPENKRKITVSEVGL